MTRVLRQIAACVVLLLGATTVFAAAPADAWQESTPEEAGSVPLMMVVKLMPGSAAQFAADLDATTSIEPLLPSRDIYQVRGEHTATLDDKGELELSDGGKDWVKEIGKHDLVLWAEIDLDISADDLRFHVWRFHVWQFHATPHNGALSTGNAVSPLQAAFDDIGVGEAHQRATGADVRIAVLDTGIDANHELLAGRVAAQYDLVDDDGDASEEANGIDDDHDGMVDEAYGHGTFVAGIVAQVAPAADIYALRVIDADGTAELYAVIEAIDMAIEMEVDIINMSFGLATREKIRLLDDALKRAKKAGILVIAAAGNGGDERKSYPAATKNVISVAALDEADSLAYFSSRGKWVTLAAPGVDITSSLPGGGYAEWGGTSMATPVVAGLAAILFEAAPPDHRKAKDITKALFDGGRSMEHKDDTDKGIVDILASLDRLD